MVAAITFLAVLVFEVGCIDARPDVTFPWPSIIEKMAWFVVPFSLDRIYFSLGFRPSASNS
jgi:hypothetical protein